MSVCVRGVCRRAAARAVAIIRHLVSVGEAARVYVYQVMEDQPAPLAGLLSGALDASEPRAAGLGVRSIRGTAGEGGVT